MSSITLKGREIPLLFTTLEMKMIQEETVPIGKLLPALVGRAESDDEKSTLYGTAEHLNIVGKAIRILGNAGLEEAGEDPDLTDKGVLRALKPSMLTAAMTACVAAIDEGMASEIPEKKADGPVDVTLEQLNKKKEKEG